MVRFATVRIQTNGYIMLGRNCWHLDSRLNGDKWGGAETFGSIEEAAAKANKDDSGAVLEFVGDRANCLHLFTDRIVEQTRRINYWPGCYGGLGRVPISKGG